MSPLSAARKFGIDTRGTALACSQQASRLISRSDARRNRTTYNKMIRTGKGKLSMVSMDKPVGHKPIPYFTGERDKRLFAAWRKRIEAGKLG